MKRSLFAAALLAFSLSLAPAREIGFVEQFALSSDRTEALKQLVPGSEDYYYYTCLHYLNEGEYGKVDELLKPWIQRYNRTQRVVEIENRLALLIYDKDAKRSLEYLRSHLGLVFNHQQEQLNPKPNLPTALDQKIIGNEALTQRALLIQNNLGGFEDAALDWVASLKLSPERLRDFLRRIKRPDVANLVQLVLADLQQPNSGGFGSLEIHNLLLLPQLEALLRDRPTLKNETRFVRDWLARLRPGNDSDWRNDAKEREAFLDRLWAYAQTLDPAHNSLKAHVLYHRLAHDRALGKYNAERFMAYIQLPRNASYVNPKYLERQENQGRMVNLGESYQDQTGMLPIGGDDELVRDYLMQIFPQEKSYDAYRPFMNDIYLKETFAECKILNGIGKAEEWTAMLPPEKYQAIKDRVELEFLPANRMFWNPGEPVGLDLRVKNVDTLIIKVFEINTASYYREFQKDIDTDIPLDGLVANDERVEKYKDGPFLRKTRHFEFDNLGAAGGRGAYVVEFIGNGKSSRALIRKGRLHFLEQAGAAGHTFMVLDENNNRVKDARLIVSAHEYTAGKDGDIVVPFSTHPGRTPVILLQGSFASLDFFQHQGESYSLKTGFHVDRESLIKRRTAILAVRPSLLVNGMPATVGLLKEISLRIQATDQDGVATTQEVNGFALFDDRESSHTFQVPERLASLSFILVAKVQNVSLNKEENLQDARAFTVNELERMEKTEATHLTRLADGYVLDLLGRSGEPRPNRPVQVTLKHRDFTEQVHVSLQSNERGRVDLGALRDIASIEASGPEGPSRKWILPAIAEHSYPGTVHGRAGQPLYIPYMGSSATPQRSELSLLELRGGAFLNDRFDAIAIESGFLKLDDLPAGDYDLLIKPSGARIQVRLAGKHGDMDAKIADDYVLAANRRLELRNPSPLQIVAVNEKRDTVEVVLTNAGPNARVHVFA
ncbi:MAG: hypothetical protein NTX50_26380, partial [Candidatus Sumerlaeota bacterium]|nr:hypothetical protein [Candidatus Sumerlaeota bacterium]